MDDLISRQAAIDTVDEALTRVLVEHRDIAEKMINKIPSAQPEPNYDEWCTDCKEYDKERHCCPRWNRVIRETLKDAQPERKTGKWVRVDEKPYFRKHFDRVCCSACRAEGISKWSFCPNCGADMRGETDEAD